MEFLKLQGSAANGPGLRRQPSRIRAAATILRAPGPPTIPGKVVPTGEVPSDAASAGVPNNLIWAGPVGGMERGVVGTQVWSRPVASVPVCARESVGGGGAPT